MNLDELRAFIAVADTGSFSAAAKSLKFAGETLRRQVDEFEAHSGVELLRRAADGVSVTRAGESLAKKGRFLLQQTRTLMDELRTLARQDGLVTIELPLGLPPQMEQAAHKAVHKAAPKLRWHIRYTDGPFNPESDATFVLHYSSSAPTDTSWSHTRLARLPTGLIASEAYLKKHGRPDSVNELSEHSLLIWERHDRSPFELPIRQGAPPVRIEPTLISKNAYLIRAHALSGEGIAFVPSSRIATFLEPDVSPTPLLNASVGDEFEIYLSVRRDDISGKVTPLASAIVRFAQAALTPLK